MERVNYLSRDNKNKLKGSKWESTKLTFERDVACGFSWPQKNYRCSFCKKEFRSAQALGGHMNVHRRDRAKLRQHDESPLASSWDHFPNPNPNPNFSSSSNISRVSTSLASFSSPSSTNPTTNEQSCWVPLLSKNNNNIMGSFLGVQAGFKGFTQENDYSRVSKKRSELLLGLDLDIGARSVIQDSKEDLDLELRLGYS